MNSMKKSLLAAVLCVALLTSSAYSQTTTTVNYVLNYTLNALPKDVIHISLADLIKVYPTLSKNICSSAKILVDNSTATIEVRDSEPTVSGPSQAVPVHLLVKLREKVGPIQYELTCTVSATTVVATGTIIVEAGNMIKENGTRAVLFRVNKDFVSNSEYVMKDQGYWPIRLFEGNNLRITQEPGASSLLNELIPATRPIVLMEKTGDKFVPTTITKLKKVSFSCPSVPSSFQFNCLIGLKEDGKTAVMFNSGAGYTNDFRWTKNIEKVLNNDTKFEFEDCFMHIGTQTTENVCYFWNAETNKTKFVSVANETISFEIAARVVGVRSLSQITCFILVEANIKKLTCINTENTIMSEFSSMLAPAVTSIRANLEGGVCTIPVDELVIRTFDTYLMFNCASSIKVVAKVDLEKAPKTGTNGKILSLSGDLSIFSGSARKVDAGVGQVSAFLCANDQHIAFLVDSFKQIAFQGVKYPGQILFSSFDVASVSAVNQVVCTGLATDIVVTAGTDKYFVSLSNLNRDQIEFQRVNLIYKMGAMDTLDVSNDGNMGIIFKKGQPLYELKDIIEVNRVLGNLKTYDPNVTTIGDYSTKIKAASAGDAKIIIRDYKISYFSTAPSIAQKPNTKAPLATTFSVYDFFDVTGTFGTVSVDPPNPHIVFNSSTTNVSLSSITVNAGARFVLGKWYIDVDLKKYYNYAQASFDLPNAANVLISSKLLAVIDDQIAVTVERENRLIIQVFSLNKAGEIVVSNQFTLPSAVLDYYSFGKVQGADGKQYLAIAIKHHEGFNNAVFSLLNYAIDATTGVFTFTDTKVNSTMLFTPDQVSSPFGIDKYFITSWNDPTHSHCLNLILSEGGLATPWVYKVCNLDTQVFSGYTLKNVKKLDADKIEVEFWAGSLSKEYGNSVTLYIIEGKIFDAGKPVIPTTVTWTKKNSTVINNGVGGLVKQYVTLGDEAILITKEVPASKSMFISGRSLKTYISYFKQNRMFSQEFENLPVSEVRSWAYIFNNNFRLITITDNASGKKTVVKDLRVTAPTIQFTNGATAQNVASSNFTFNKGQPNEVKVPITAALNAPPAPPANSSGGSIWIWIIVIVLLLVIAVGVYFLFFRREKIRRDSQAGKSGNDSHIEEHL